MLLNFFRISETGNQRRYASAAESSSAHDDPRGTLLCHGTHVPITQKPPQALSLETVIIVYNRGTTQIDINVHFQCTTMHPSLITGLVPDGSYSFHFGPPSKVHSAIPSILQSHRLQLSVISEEGLLLFLIGFSLFSILYLTTVKKSIPSLKFFQFPPAAQREASKTGFCKWRRRTTPLHHYCSHAASTFSNGRSPPYKSSALPTVT